MALEVNGTRGAAKWNFERMNELELYLPGDDGLHDGLYARCWAGPRTRSTGASTRATASAWATRT